MVWSNHHSLQLTVLLLYSAAIGLDFVAATCAKTAAASTLDSVADLATVAKWGVPAACPGTEKCCLTDDSTSKSVKIKVECIAACTAPNKVECNDCNNKTAATTKIEATYQKCPYYDGVPTGAIIVPDKHFCRKPHNCAAGVKSDATGALTAYVGCKEDCVDKVKTVAGTSQINITCAACVTPDECKKIIDPTSSTTAIGTSTPGSATNTSGSTSGNTSGGKTISPTTPPKSTAVSALHRHGVQLQVFAVLTVALNLIARLQSEI